MDTKEKTFEIGPFAGLNNNIDPGTIEDNELSELKNLDVEINGSLIPRPGLVDIGNPITNFGQGASLIGTLVTAAGSSILVYNGTGPSQFLSSENEGVTWTVRASPAASPSVGDMIFPGVQYVNKLYFTYDGTLYSWDGAAIVAIAGAAGLGLSHLFIHKDRLFGISYNAGTTSRLYYSSVADFTTWPGTNFLDIDPGDGDLLTTGLSYNDMVFLFKRNKTHQLTVQGDPSEWAVRLAFRVGSIGRLTACVNNNIIYFLSMRGVYQTNGSELVLISDKVFMQPYLRLYSSDPASTYLNGRRVALITYMHKVICMLPKDTNIWYVYDTKINTWSNWRTDPSVSALDAFRPYDSGAGSNIELLAIVGWTVINTKPKLVSLPDRITVTTDYGFQYTISITTKAFDFGDSYMKRGKWGFGEFTGQGLGLAKWLYDLSIGPGLTITMGGSTRKIQKFRGPRMFRQVSLQISQTSPTTDFTVNKLGLVYRSLGRRLSKETTSI